MSLRLEAIKPTRPVLDVAKIKAGVDRELRTMAADVVNKIATYPPQEDTDYVRSGQLGSHWRMVPVSPGRIDIINNVVTTQVRRRLKSGVIRTYRVKPRAYAVYVQGSITTDPGQARVMGDKGWSRIDEVAEEVFSRHSGIVVRLLTGGS